jgi:hypothetical protein
VERWRRLVGRLASATRRGRSFSLLPKSAGGWAQRPSVRVAFIGPTPLAPALLAPSAPATSARARAGATLSARRTSDRMIQDCVTLSLSLNRSSVAVIQGLTEVWVEQRRRLCAEESRLVSSVGNRVSPIR